ncbi:hypothetical protein [Variovorax sp. efr-133-TYG-130]|jgi:hypothetical protein|uniref:hypothetical protein n=1 Tax=Variovorax sp. efr-133-TYG-130 TaxID=3040327 RepID=UPI002554BFAC|nr:hypothetical protein [Variovorax sp. efr-133-TYG-130]
MKKSKPPKKAGTYDIKKQWHWGRAMRELRIADFLKDGRLLVPGEYTGEGPATDDGTGALRTVGGIQVGAANYETGMMWVGRKLREGDLPSKPGGTASD